MEVVKLGSHSHTQTLVIRSLPPSSSSSRIPFIFSRMTTRGRRRRNSLRRKLPPQVHSPIPTPNHNISNDGRLQHVQLDVSVEVDDNDKDNDKDDRSQHVQLDVSVEVDDNDNDNDNDKDKVEDVADLAVSELALFQSPAVNVRRRFSNVNLSTLGFGFGFVSSFLLLFGLSKLFFTLFSGGGGGGGDEGMSPLQREMLRRKIKARMRKSVVDQHHEHPQEQTPSVGVELVVAQDNCETTPPPLDHSILFHTIRTHPHPRPPTIDIHTTTAAAAAAATTTTTTLPVPPQTHPESLIDQQPSTSVTHNNDNVPISTLRKPKLILSLDQARDYLSRKHDKPHHSDHSSSPYTSLEPVLVPNIPIDAADSNQESVIVNDIAADLKNQASFSMQVNMVRHDQIHATPDHIYGSYDEEDSSFEGDAASPVQESYHQDFNDNDVEDQTSLEFGNSTQNMSDPRFDNETWLQSNFHEVEPIVNKIGAGFRNNYTMAREKVKQQDISLDFLELESIKDDTELEWMQDDKLREIVFRVRDNELAGRDPFHSIDPEDKIAFFNGLETKVQKENEKLSILHAWLHSNIENMDYGADGISLYDPPDKVVPRWKGPPIDKLQEFLTKPVEQPKVASSVQKGNGSALHDKTKLSRANSTPNEVTKISKTVIEASDGSIKPGRKSGKEYWQHTKKWSRGFLESYNAESDPEVKSVMKDIGKDLNRWITEEEIKEAASFMDKIPQRGKEYIEKKLNKLKREMELFGPAAVVSKYREYDDEKEEDYLWWLDLRYVLCIELYTYEAEDQRIGFYSLEMAADLELDPKPQHVIAFEDPGDCKNLCYIIQAHLEMLGSGRAFIVAQPPKDVFRQAKANGFGVTVIRKGELHLNIDQPLEEVEESIAEIGSKMYHDKIMRERSVDISSLMKGVFGSSNPSNRRRRKRAQTSIDKL